MKAFINDKAYALEGDESILEFTRRHEGYILPTLCIASNLKPIGSCRLCYVEVDNGDGNLQMVTSCSTPVSEGQKIYTDTEKLKRLRRNTIELILSDHPERSSDREENSQFDFIVDKYGPEKVRYPQGRNHLEVPTDDSHPYMVSELSKCIRCHRCVEACESLQGQFVLSMYGRGFDTRVIKGADVSYSESACVSCGACSDTCPTGAISDIFRSNYFTDEEKFRTVCTYCGVGCNLEVGVKNGEITRVQAPYDAEVNEGHLCVKGRYAFTFHRHPDRLKTPLIRRNGQLSEATWDEAYDFIREKLESIRQEFGPDQIAGISSSRCTNEENYLMQKFIRAVVGTNNIDGCARICHAPTAAGMQRAFGTGAATNSIEDLEYTDCILVIGANPTSAHPVTGAKIKQQAIKGKTLIVVDPRKTELAKYADIHIQLRPGSNIAVLNLMLHYLVKNDVIDKDFIASRCEGYDEFRDQILQIDVDQLESVCGVDRDMIEKGAMTYAEAANSMAFHGLGVTEHYQGSYGVMLIANLALLTGNIGRRGVGVNPLRGQNNVQGSADMGVQPHQGAGYKDITDERIRKTYEEFYGAPLSPEPGFTIPEMMDAILEDKLKALWIMGEDVAQTEPNTDKVVKALGKLDLLVIQEIFLSETAKLADVVLPGATFFEKSGTFTNGERRIQRVNKILEPLGDSRPDGQIVIDMMNRMGYSQPDYDPATMLEEISQIVPFFKGVRWEELGNNGKQWPVDEEGNDTRILHTTTFSRGKGKIHFIPFEETPELVEHQERFPLILTTNRISPLADLSVT